MDKYTTGAKEIIANNIYMTIATVSSENTPWISPVFFVYDTEFNFYWVSYKESRHSRYVQENNQIAISIFDSKVSIGDGDGVYVEGIASIISNKSEIEDVVTLWNSRVIKDVFKITGIDQVTDEGVWRIYKAKPSKIYKLAEGKYINGQYIDSRVEVNLLKNYKI